MLLTRMGIKGGYIAAEVFITPLAPLILRGGTFGKTPLLSFKMKTLSLSLPLKVRGDKRGL